MLKCIVKTVKLLAIIGLLILVAVMPAWAKPSATVTIDRNQITTGDTAQLVITLNDASLSQLELPEIKGLQLVPAGKSTQVQIINGRYSTTNAFTYLITPKKPGTYQLGPFSIRVGKQTITTNVINLSVTGPNQVGNNAGTTKNAVGDGDRIYLEVKLPRHRIYLGEKLPIKIRLLIREDLQVSDVTYPALNQPAVVLKQMEKPAQSKQIINGISYQVLDFTTEISGVKSGKIILGPFTVNCNILTKHSTGDSFFDDFFADYTKEPVQLNSNRIPLEILPLPTKGQPADFSGGIGNFQISASAGAQNVSQGDPISIKLTVTGEGNLENIAPPQLADSTGFKVYGAQRKHSDKQQTVFEQVLIPLDSKLHQVGPYTLTYFNTVTGSYQKIHTKPIPIKVAPNPNFKAGNPVRATLPAGGETLGKDLIFIKNTPGKLRLIAQPLQRQVWFWLLQLLPLAALTGTISYQRYLHSNAADTPKARALQARSQALQGLGKARKLLACRQAGEVIEQLHLTIRDYLGLKYNLSTAGMTGTVVEELTELPPELQQKIKNFFERYDFYRFTGAEISPADAEQLMDLAGEIIANDNAVTVINKQNTGSRQGEGSKLNERS
ncbi:MAG TPA: BatD family protein [Bacillota bacterium]